MERVVEDFILYLHETKNTSKNTEVSYERDLKKLGREPVWKDWDQAFDFKR